MAANRSPTVHASAVLVGAHAVLIRGPSGSGKSRLALALLEAAESGQIHFARLVGDDRVHVDAVHDRILVRPHAALAGLIEVRGLGIRRVAFEPVARVGLVVDLAAADAARLPEAATSMISLSGISLPRLPVAPSGEPFRLVLAALHTTDST